MNTSSSRRALLRAVAHGAAGVALASGVVLPAAAHDDRHDDRRDDRHSDGRFIYTLNNVQGDNRVLVLEQRPGGSLVNVNAVSTGGAGLGANLGSQGALALSDDGRWLFAVNAGSNTISTFLVDDERLRLVSTVASGGTMPISVTSRGRVVYVLNAGGTGNITGFRLRHDGRLAPIAGSTQGLGGPATGPAQIQFSNGGDFLIVSEKAANQLAVFEVEDDVARPAKFTPSAGNTPFGFDIDPRDHVIVSEAATRSASSYALRDRTDDLDVISAAVPTGQLAPCWLVVTPNGRFAYTGNAGSGNITGFAVRRDGILERISASGADGSTGAGSHTIDLAVSGDGRYLYALADVGQTVTAFRISRDGSLRRVGQFAGVPASTVGLVAR